MINDFLKGFENEPEDIIMVKSTTDFTCPTPPATTKVSAEGRSNYATLPPNQRKGFGMTGLMAMNTWNSCYGQVRPGYIFLFLGIQTDKSPIYEGIVSIKCAPHKPIHFDGSRKTLHQHMCDLLGRPTTDFIGFSCIYPYSSHISYNSEACNPYWFNGSRTIPTNCDGVKWKEIIYNTLADWL